VWQVVPTSPPSSNLNTEAVMFSCSPQTYEIAVLTIPQSKKQT
jgi:hypothetical protein